MGVGFVAGFFVGLDPLPKAGIDHENEMVIRILGETQEGGSAELGGFGACLGLNRAFVVTPFEMGSVAGVHELDGVGPEVGEVESVEVAGSKLKDRDDLLAIEVQNFEAPIGEDPGQREEQVLNRDVESMS